MTSDEQGELLLTALSTLARRCSLDPYYSLPHADDGVCNELAEELDARLMLGY
jgi:hypothetical protein